jgi:hypothetical protein
MEIVVGHPFKKGHHSPVKHGFRVRNFQDLLEVLVLILRHLPKDIACNPAVVEGYHDPVTHTDFFPEALRQGIGKGLFDGEGNGYPQAGTFPMLLVQRLDLRWPALLM